VVYEIRAFWEDAAVDHGTTREGSLRYRITRSHETWVVKRADAEVTEGELMSWISERVPSYKKVRRVAFIDEIPRSLSGKILRRVLVEKERGAS